MIRCIAIQRTGTVMLAMLTATLGALHAQPAAEDRPTALFSAFVGKGTFATGLDVVSNRTSASVPVLGAAVEIDAGRRFRLALSAGAGSSLGGSPGSSPSGVFGDAAALWLVTPQDQAWGIFVGPGVTYTRFGPVRAGADGVGSAGVRRGIGPRLTLRTHAMSGDEIGVTTRAEFGLVITR